MKAQELRQKYLDFFVSKGHGIIPSASLIPENDPTVLFTTAGMHPLVPFLLGESHASGSRLVNVQKCIRTGDIDEVGDTTHNTFFEMLGNWSLGDYFKKEAIEWSWEFLTSDKWLALPKEKIAVTVFAGDDDAPRDDESVGIWKSLGVPDDKIAYLGKRDNWWGPAGQTGPCGPDTEMFYYVGQGSPAKDSNPGTKPEEWVEIWNDVFMEYNKNSDGSYESLQQKNVDTGMGLERTLMILEGQNSIYETELFQPIIAKIRELASGATNAHSERVIADHLRSAVFILGDPAGVVPSNLDQGYILRRLIRRAIRHGKNLGIEDNFIAVIASVVIANYHEIYGELKANKQRIIDELNKEEIKFSQTIDLALKQFRKSRGSTITAEEAFDWFQTYGLPLEMTIEEASRENIALERGIEKKFETEFKKHQDLSRAGAAQKFAGGLADDSAMSRRLHTATHLLHQALRNVLGDHVYQRGSNITSERLRFDFSHPDKLTAEQLKEIEEMVNEQIAKDLEVSFTEMTVEEAKDKGAIGIFEEKYGSRVKVYKIGDFSMEICGGPHVETTGEIGNFKIKKEEASSAGIRRIKAVVD